MPGEVTSFREHPSVEPFDYCGHDGAKILSARIESYWAARGYQIQITLHNTGFVAAMRSVRTDVRSNMQNGWPKAAPLPSQKRNAA